MSPLKDREVNEKGNSEFKRFSNFDNFCCFQFFSLVECKAVFDSVSTTADSTILLQIYLRFVASLHDCDGKF